MFALILLSILTLMPIVMMWLLLTEVYTINSLTELGWLVCVMALCIIGIMFGVATKK